MTVDVIVTGDTVDESNGTFTLALSAPVGPTMTDTEPKFTSSAAA